ncbi:g9854 [Coccomyxa elongata]
MGQACSCAQPVVLKDDADRAATEPTGKVQLTAVDRGSANEKALDAAIKSVLNKRQAGRSQPGLPPVSQVEAEEFNVQPGPGRAADFDPDKIAVELRDRCDSAYRPNVVPLSTMSPISDRHSCEQTSQGLPYETVNLGPPKPPCNDDRVATIRSLNCSDGPPDPQLEHIVQLACTVFGTANALVALLDSERIIIRNGSGMFAPGDFPWRYSFCGYTLTPANPTTMVIEDAHKDARFKHNVFVNGDPPVRFYCGTPLIASNGHRLGTLCFADHEPHTFDAERCNILNNMAELCVREIEREYMLREQSQQPSELELMNAGMKRALEAFQEAILMVDTSKESWTVLHVNSAFSHQTGMKREAIVKANFWEVFGLNDCEQVPEAVKETALLGKEFTITNVRIRDGITVELPDSGIHSAGGDCLFTMGFRPANRDQLDDNTLAIGVPSYMPSSEKSGRGLYFVSMRAVAAMTSIASTTSSLCETHLREPPFEGLELGTLLGRGGYGSVYRGSYMDQRCAVKVIEDLDAIAMRDGKPLEAVITEGICHPNIVNTIAHTMQHTAELPRRLHDSAQSSLAGTSDGPCKSGSAASHDKAGQGLHSKGVAWLLLEYCDMGCLQEAIDKGWLREERTLTSPDGVPNLATILAVAREVASGMAFLHEHGVVHGDLTGGNVLLTSSAEQPHGFTAKVADFGLARNLNITSKVETRTYGTITHMPRELLCDGIMSKPADVYAFGVLLWEMMSGCRAWASMKHAQVMHCIVVEQRSLVFPSHTPDNYRRFAQRCLSHNPKERPSFTEACAEIAAMQA